MKSLTLTNAQIVTEHEVIKGTLHIQDGKISAIDTGVSTLAAAQDLQGDYLLPGLIELHTDNLEKHYSPRPGVIWPSLPAVISHDAQISAAGITTVFDALTLGDDNQKARRSENIRAMTDAVTHAQNKNLLRAEHLLHMRCEVSCEDVISLWEAFADDRLVKLVSVMDHAPGQRQFVSLDKYRLYYQKKYNLNDAQMQVFIEEQTEAAKKHSDRNRKHIVESCKARDLPIASHDDATEEHVEESAGYGMVVAEFPTTEVAAKASKAHGMGVMAGAPNMVRGQSHSGNISARELAALGLVDILSSDYVPVSLLHSAFLLHELNPDISLPRAIATVSSTPAEIVGLQDRGKLAAGKRGDVIRVYRSDDLPVVREVWREGLKVQ